MRQTSLSHFAAKHHVQFKSGITTTAHVEINACATDVYVETLKRNRTRKD